MEFGIVEITDPINEHNLKPGRCLALLSHSGSRGFGANVARHYTKVAMDKRKMPAEARHLAWLDLDTEAGQEYWAPLPASQGMDFDHYTGMYNLMRLRAKWALLALMASFFCISVDGVGKNGGPDTANFVLVKENNGISLYERWYAFAPDQQARELKATFNVKADSYAAVALIKDAARGRQWNKNTKAYEIVRESDNLWFGYIQYDLPWPVSNQDCVLQYNQNDLETGVLVEFQDADHPSFPPRKKIQRIPEIYGKWIFRESDDGISVEYYISTTPSNALPTWLTDPIIRNNLIETLTIFRTILERKN